MRKQTHSSALGAAFAQNGFYKMLVVVLGLATAILSLALLFAMNNTRVVVVPPEISKTFWVDRDAVSKEYLEQMGMFIAQLELNVSPASQGFQAKELLKYVDPSFAGAMETKFLAAGRELKQDSASTWFRPIMIRVDAQDKEVAITGEYRVTVADKEVVKTNKTYLEQFRMDGGRIFLTRFEEVKESQLFQPKGANGTTAAAQPKPAT